MMDLFNAPNPLSLHHISLFIHSTSIYYACLPGISIYSIFYYISTLQLRHFGEDIRGGPWNFRLDLVDGRKLMGFFIAKLVL